MILSDSVEVMADASNAAVKFQAVFLGAPSSGIRQPVNPDSTILVTRCKKVIVGTATHGPNGWAALRLSGGDAAFPVPFLDDSIGTGCEEAMGWEGVGLGVGTRCFCVGWWQIRGPSCFCKAFCSSVARPAHGLDGVGFVCARSYSCLDTPVT